MICLRMTIHFGFTDILRCSFSQIKANFNFLEGTTYGVRDNVQEKLAKELLVHLEDFLNNGGFDASSKQTKIDQFKRYVKEISDKQRTESDCSLKARNNSHVNHMASGDRAAGPVSQATDVQGRDNTKSTGFCSSFIATASREEVSSLTLSIPRDPPSLSSFLSHVPLNIARSRHTTQQAGPPAGEIGSHTFPAGSARRPHSGGVGAGTYSRTPCLLVPLRSPGARRLRELTSLRTINQSCFTM
jgi:hypothetical protein